MKQRFRSLHVMALYKYVYGMIIIMSAHKILYYCIVTQADRSRGVGFLLFISVCLGNCLFSSRCLKNRCS